MRKLLLASLLAFGGCYTEASVGTGYSGGGDPALVEVDGAPGVTVVADADDPVFFSDGFYWRYYGNTWYSSSYYGGWTVARDVPVRVRGISNPRAYVHYRTTLARQGRQPTYVRRDAGSRRVEPVRRTETIRREPARTEVRRTEPVRTAPVRTAPARTTTVHREPAHEEPAHNERH